MESKGLLGAYWRCKQSKVVLSLQPMSNLAGLLLVSWHGVVCCTNKYSSTLSCQLLGPIFPNASLADLTAHSTDLLLAGWNREIRQCWIPNLARNNSNMVAVNWGPLSDTNRLGNPCMANAFLRALITASKVVECINMISTHFCYLLSLGIPVLVLVLQNRYVCGTMVPLAPPISGLVI